MLILMQYCLGRCATIEESASDNIIQETAEGEYVRLSGKSLAV